MEQLQVVFATVEGRETRTKLRICKDNLFCFEQKQNPTSLKRQNVLFQDVRFYHKELETTWELRMLRNIGIASPADSWLSLERKILRVVLNPSDELTQVILQERERIGPAEYQVGVHIRCAGKLSDEKESVRMVTADRFRSSGFYAKQMLKSIASEQGYVFLTTDSTYAETTSRREWETPRRSPSLDTSADTRATSV